MPYGTKALEGEFDTIAKISASKFQKAIPKSAVIQFIISSCTKL